MSCTIFDQVALDYDQVRPGYPEELVEDVVFISAIPKEERILENRLLDRPGYDPLREAWIFNDLS